MQYAGGKSRTASALFAAVCENEISGRKIENRCGNSRNGSKNRTEQNRTEQNRTEQNRSSYLNENLSCERRVFVSLFCGGCAVEEKAAKSGMFDRIICNDLHPYLISMWRGLQDGTFVPPDVLSEDEYKYIRKHRDENRALSGFAGFGCAFGGQFFHGYGRYRDKDGNFVGLASQSKRNVLRMMEGGLQKAEFLCLDYRDVPIPDGAVVYCDPPYAGTDAEYSIRGTGFDAPVFWEYVRDISRRAHVYVSELTAPDDFTCIWERELIVSAHSNSPQAKERVESRRTMRDKLFVYSGI